MDFVPIPTFSSENVSIWFAQIESAFVLNEITTESEKFDYVIAHIPSDSLKIVEDVVLNPPTNVRYKYFKSEYIKRVLVDKLKKEEFGNQKPSEYLEKLERIAARRVSLEVIMDVWLNNLPEKVREIVRMESSGTPFKLSVMADMVMSLVTPSPQHIEGLSSNQFEMIMRRVDELSKQIQTLQMMVEGEYEYEDAPQASSQNKTKTSRSPKVLCWHHTNFGDKAIACIAPCHYNFSPTKNDLRKPQ